MNFYLSLLIYNPLEAFILIYFCSIFGNFKLNKNILKECYILGSINLAVQYMGRNIENDALMFLYDIFISIIVTPILLFIFIRLFHNITDIKLCIFSAIFNFLTLFASLFLLNFIKGIDVIFTGFYSEILHEFLLNIYIKIFQIFILYLLRIGVIVLKDLLKKIAIINTEKFLIYLRLS